MSAVHVLARVYIGPEPMPVLASMFTKLGLVLVSDARIVTECTNSDLPVTLDGLLADWNDCDHWQYVVLGQVEVVS